MTARVVCRIKPYIQPFERVLAIQELSEMSSARPKPIDANQKGPEFEVRSAVSAQDLAARLAYWEHVRGSGEIVPTLQVLREATVGAVRNGISPQQLRALLPFRSSVPAPNRRCLRYGPHGLHEYRGKFFPQLVRALVNAAGVEREGVIADPMCGSGTTLVEGVLAHQLAIGIDINPLSVLMSQTKCELLSASPDMLVRVYEQVSAGLETATAKGGPESASHLAALPVNDQEYLSRWFPKAVLADLDRVAAAIKVVHNRPLRNLCWLSLSNILRRVSWQKDDDLRVRKEVRRGATIDCVREFREELTRSVRLLLAFLLQNPPSTIGRFVVQESDARTIDSAWVRWGVKVDVIVTSPPYATALPYLDTDRLSLIYLGLLSRSKHRYRDREMIGNREITNAWKRAYLEAFASERRALPVSIANLIDRVQRLNDGAEVGFRRQNMAALLAKYFLDMRRVLEGMFFLLKPGGKAFVVIGDNHTVAGGERVNIRTSQLLLELAEVVGFSLEQKIPMEMLVSRDLFRKNAVPSEAILCMRKVR